MSEPGQIGRENGPVRLIFQAMWLVLLLAWVPVLFGQGDDGIQELRNRAETAYEEGRLLEALADYEKLVSLFPEEGCLHGRLAACALREPGRLNLARRHMGIAMRSGCAEVDLDFHRARLAQLEYKFDKAADLYAAYLMAAGKKAAFVGDALRWQAECLSVQWDPSEAVGLRVEDKIPAEPDLAFRYYRSDQPGLRLVNVPNHLRSKEDELHPAGRMAFHDGDTVLVYSSWGKKGKTGSDLYRITLSGGEYGLSERLPEGVNTEYDEADAHLSSDGILYFSSNRPGGLGGTDIYAVRWMEGTTAGDPYRLPYPINTVNDDAFFVPETHGGAWLSSTRAASEGRIHAYRIDLSEQPFSTGSVSWVAEEWEAEGLTLRVYSGGELVAESAASGQTHLDLPVPREGEGVRITIEDRDGDIVAESFGQGEESWRLRKGSSGWVVEEQTDTDWAALADFQAVGPKRASTADDGLAASAEEVAPSWSDWVASQWPELPGPEGAMASAESLGTEAASPSPRGDDRLEMDPAERENGASLDGEPTVGVASADLDQPLPTTPDAVAEWVEDHPEDVLAVWEGKAKIALDMERDFLDDPDMTRAGEFYDLIDDLRMWSPDAEEMDAQLLDALDFDEILDMLDTWTYAVQSATNPALAEVAGNAALAFRREKLAIRELWKAEGINLRPLMTRWSDWRDARRGVDGVDESAAVMSLEEGDALLENWMAVLSAAESTWSRKQMRGWRGAWKKRQEDQLSLHQEVWASVREDMLELALADPEEEKEPSNAEATEGTIAAEPSDVAASNVPSEETLAQDSAGDDDSREADLTPGEGLGWLYPPGGEASEQVEGMALIGALFGGHLPLSVGEMEEPKGATGNGSGAPNAGGSTLSMWMEQWAEALVESKAVRNRSTELMRAAGNSGVPVVEDERYIHALDREVQASLLALREEALKVLSQLVQSSLDGWRSRTSVIERKADEHPSLRGETLWTDWLSQREELVELESRRKALDRAAKKGAWAEQSALEEAEWASVLALMELERLEGMLERRVQELDRDMAESMAAEVAVSGDEGVDNLAMTNGESGSLSASDSSPGDGTGGAPEEEVMEQAAAEQAALEQVAGGEDETPLGVRNQPQDPAAEASPAAPEDILSISTPSEWEQGAAGPSISSSEAPGGEFLFPAMGELPEPARREWAAALTRGVEALKQESEAQGISLLEQTGWPLLLTTPEGQLVSAWMAWAEVQEALRESESSRQRNEAQKRQFFVERDLRDAFQALQGSQPDLAPLAFAETLERIWTQFEPSEVAMAEESSATGEAPEVLVSGGDDGAMGEGEAVSVVSSPVLIESTIEDEELRSWGVTLPAADVVVQGSGNSSGIRLRPISREEMERRILSRSERTESWLVAEDRFATENAAPVAEGVEYKVQIGAFRKPLPAALFAAFDPMWAQTLSNGITRYMAGSFDAYDPAVIARDAIRDMGYSDAFVVRFVDGERVRAARPEPEALAVERQRVPTQTVAATSSSLASNGLAARPPSNAESTTEGNGAITSINVPTRTEDIETWTDVSGRVYSVQVGAFRGVPDAAALRVLGKLTREDAGQDGWLRLFSGRFATETEAREHQRELRTAGLSDAFVVVYINGKRIPLTEASTTATGSLDALSSNAIPNQQAAAQPEQASASTNGAPAERRWRVRLGEFESTIPVRLANAILDAPMAWQIRANREGGVTSYSTAAAPDRATAERWLIDIRALGFPEAALLSSEE